MATFRVEIHQGLLPDTSGNVYWASGHAGGGFDRYPAEVLLFTDTATDIGASGMFIPKNYSTSVTTKIIIRWASTVADATKNVVWSLDLTPVADNETLDPSADTVGIYHISEGLGQHLGGWHAGVVDQIKVRAATDGVPGDHVQVEVAHNVFGIGGAG